MDGWIDAAAAAAGEMWGDGEIVWRNPIELLVAPSHCTLPPCHSALEQPASQPGNSRKTGRNATDSNAIYDLLALSIHLWHYPIAARGPQCKWKLKTLRLRDGVCSCNNLMLCSPQVVHSANSLSICLWPQLLEPSQSEQQRCSK